MRTSLFLKTLGEIYSEVIARNNDSTPAIATQAQYYAGINEAVQMWAGRVLVPQLYSFTGGFSSGTFAYTLPAYVRPPLQLQIRSTAYNVIGGEYVQQNADTTFTWHNLAGGSVEPVGDGTWLVRMPILTYSEEGRVIWWAENGPMITSAVELASGLTASSTSASLTVISSPEVNDFGFFKIGDEWISYGGLTRTSSTSYTATNLVRGLYGTTAAIHNSAAAVSWGVGVDDQRLWVQLRDYVTAYVHALSLHKSTTEDAGRHEKMMSYFSTKADNFWRTQGYVPNRNPKMVITSDALGPISW